MTSYHMRRTEKQITDAVEFEAVLKNGTYTTVALCRGEEPYLVTMNYGYDEERNALYFHCAREGQKIDFIVANSRVCATVVEDHGYRMGECDHAYRSLVIRGRMVVVEGLAEKKHALETMLFHLEDDPDVVRQRQLKNEDAYRNVGILRLDVEHVTGKTGLRGAE